MSETEDSAQRSRVLLLFDVDGTLTAPRRCISDELQRFLVREVLPRAAAGLVSGSDRAKLDEQLGGAQHAATLDYVFCENGLAHYRRGALVSQGSILRALGERATQRLINYALRYLADIELPAKRGNFIEFRSSMINISPVGRSCSQEERDQFYEYDTRHKIREKFVEALKKEFANSDLTFALGGQISIDVFPKGWDKTYCLNHLSDANFTEIHFFGDKTEPGGNDYELFSHEKVIGHRVTSPEDTKNQVKALLNIP